jgi:CubicO group peptidase (beta-lactamase class C family)
VTTVSPHEAAAAPLGVVPGGVDRIWRAVERLYQSGVHPAIQVCVRRHGEIVLDRAIWHASGNGPDDLAATPKVALTPETPICAFSASKAVTAMLIHLLDERHLIHLDDPVCEYIPEFGTSAKRWITIRHVLTHRAGIPSPPAEVMDLGSLEVPDQVVRLLASLPQAWRPGRQLAYHAITGGFVLGEIVRRVTGQDIREVMAAEICAPLGFRWSNFGVAPADVPLVATNYLTGPPAIPPLSWMLTRALGTDVRRIIEMSNDPRFFAVVIPAGNLITTARELSLFFQVLLAGGVAPGGRRLFEARTIRRATSEQSYLEFDFTLVLPFRYGMGFMLGDDWFSIFGPDTPHAYGHIGFSNIIAWADPDRAVAATILTTGKPLLYLELLQAWQVLREISAACPKVTGPR